MNPRSRQYRSPVYRKFEHLDAEYVELNGYAVASSVGEAEAELAATRRLSLCDLSGLSRVGIKGPGTCAWISEQGLTVPENSNRSLRQGDGCLLARLAPNEVLVLGDMDQQSNAIEELVEAWHAAADAAARPGGFIVPRQDSHAWFRITGSKTAETLAKLCAVDLRAGVFDNLEIAQTSVARLNAIVIRDDLADVHAFHLLADSASAGYYWDCLLDAGLEHDIRVVGWNALRNPKEA